MPHVNKTQVGVQIPFSHYFKIRQKITRRKPPRFSLQSDLMEMCEQIF